MPLFRRAPAGQRVLRWNDLLWHFHLFLFRSDLSLGSVFLAPSWKQRSSLIMHHYPARSLFFSIVWKVKFPSSWWYFEQELITCFWSSILQRSTLLLLRICNVHKSGKFALWWKHSWIVICQLDFMDTSFVWRKKKRGKVNNSRQCHLRWWGFNDGEPSSHLSTSPQRDKGPPTVSGTVRGINSTFCACVRVCLEACALWKWQIVRRWSR